MKPDILKMDCELRENKRGYNEEKKLNEGETKPTKSTNKDDNDRKVGKSYVPLQERTNHIFSSSSWFPEIYRNKQSRVNKKINGNQDPDRFSTSKLSGQKTKRLTFYRLNLHSNEKVCK